MERDIDGRVDPLNTREMVQTINELIHSSRLGPIRHEEFQGQSNKIFGFGEEQLSFVGNSYNIFGNVVSAAWHHRIDLFQTVSEKTFESRLASLIREMKRSSCTLDQATLQSLFNSLSDLPIEEWEMFQRLYGVQPLSGQPVQFGPFHIYQWGQHNEIIRSRYQRRLDNLQSGALQWEDIWHRVGEDDATLVSVQIRSRESTRALEVASEKFRQFERTIRFMIGRHLGHFDVGIFDYRKPEMFETVGFTSTHASSRGQLTGALQPLPINDEYFRNPSLGNDVIWGILGLNELTDMQRRILTAIEWGGKGARDFDPAKAFVQFMFGIESLLTFQGQGVLVTPSVASKIAEFTAFILGTDFESRQGYYSTLSRLYSKRSAIAHSGSSNVLPSDVQECFDVLRMLINNLLTSPELREMQSVSKLREWVEHEKYS